MQPPQQNLRSVLDGAVGHDAPEGEGQRRAQALRERHRPELERRQAEVLLQGLERAGK